MITSNTGISLEVLISIAAGIVAWVGSYMTTKTKVDNLQNSVNTLTSEINAIYNKLKEETNTVKFEMRNTIDKLEQESKTNYINLESELNNTKNELFNAKLDLQNYIEEKSKTIFNKIDILREHTNSLNIISKELEIKVGRIYKEIDKYIESNNKKDVIGNLREILELLKILSEYKDKT